MGNAIAPERAWEKALGELVVAYWPEGAEAPPEMRASRTDEPVPQSGVAIVVECLKVERMGGNLEILKAEADVFLQCDRQGLSQAEVDAVTGALEQAVRAIEGGLTVTVAADEHYPEFAVHTHGRVEIISHGPEAEAVAGGRMRRDGLKCVAGFSLEVTSGLPPARLAFTLSGGGGHVLVMQEGVPVSLGAMRLLAVTAETMNEPGYLLVTRNDELIGRVRLGQEPE